MRSAAILPRFCHSSFFPSLAFFLVTEKRKKKAATMEGIKTELYIPRKWYVGRTTAVQSWTWGSRSSACIAHVQACWGPKRRRHDRTSPCAWPAEGSGKETRERAAETLWGRRAHGTSTLKKHTDHAPGHKRSRFDVADRATDAYFAVALRTMVEKGCVDYT